jgi:GTP-binding protein
VVVANKADSAVREAISQEAYALGLGEVFPVSALHGLAIGELLDKVVDELGEAAPFEEPEDFEEAAAIPEVAIVGRPNVGKSTLFNALVAEERAIVSEVPGTTRDAIDTIVETPNGRKYRFVDTAGLRKERKYRDTVEFYSATRTFRAIDRADVAILVLDATEGVTRQDQAIAERILAGGSGVVVALNKWDAVDAEQREAARLGVKERLRFLHFAPVLEISALTGKGLGRILPTVDAVLEAYEWRVGTGQLNAVLEEIVSQHPPPVDRRRGKRPKTLYATQAARRPPTFVFFTSAPLPEQYLRYLENQLRARLGIGPTPVKMKVVPRRRARGR